jgi:hypothetical protein
LKPNSGFADSEQAALLSIKRTFMIVVRRLPTDAGHQQFPAKAGSESATGAALELTQESGSS